MMTLPQQTFETLCNPMRREAGLRQPPRSRRRLQLTALAGCRKSALFRKTGLVHKVLLSSE